MNLKPRLIDSFKAVADDGEVFEILYLREQFFAGHLNDATTVKDGQDLYITASGGPVNKIDSQQFQIVRRNKIVRKL